MQTADGINIKKKRIIYFLCFLLLFFLVRAAVLYLIEPVDYSIFFNHTIKNKAARNDNHIDMVFIGASRPQRSFDPEVFEKELGLSSVYNASSGLQLIESSYYMLKEVAERYSVDYAVLGVTTGTIFNGNSTLAKVIVLDRLHGWNKIEYLLNCFEPDEYLNALSLCYRFRNNFNLEFIKKNLKEKSTLRSNHYSERWDDPDLYKENGFVYSYQTGEIESGTLGNVDLNGINPVKLEYLEKIVKYCEDKHITLFLVIPPRSMMHLYSFTNYQDIVDFYTDFAARHNIPVTNLNYLRGREEWLGDDMMFDSGHVNGEGAERVSEKYASILKALISNEVEPDLFYQDIAELKADVHRILAVGADIKITDLVAKVKIRSIQTDDIEPLYRIRFKNNEDGELILLADWTDKTEFEFDLSAYRGTAHFLIEAMDPGGFPGAIMNYNIPI